MIRFEEMSCERTSIYPLDGLQRYLYIMHAGNCLEVFAEMVNCNCIILYT